MLRPSHSVKGAERRRVPIRLEEKRGPAQRSLEQPEGEKCRASERHKGARRSEKSAGTKKNTPLERRGPGRDRAIKPRGTMCIAEYPVLAKEKSLVKDRHGQKRSGQCLTEGRLTRSQRSITRRMDSPPTQAPLGDRGKKIGVVQAGDRSLHEAWDGNGTPQSAIRALKKPTQKKRKRKNRKQQFIKELPARTQSGGGPRTFGILPKIKSVQREKKGMKYGTLSRNRGKTHELKDFKSTYRT